MYSIPHKQFAIPRGYPIFFSTESMSCKGGGNVTTSFSTKKGWGVSFLGRKLPNLGMETHPLMFSYTKGRGVYI